MSQIFKRRSNSLAQMSLIAAGLILTVIAVVLTAFKWSSWQTEAGVPESQPVPFSHEHHVSGLGLDCRYCHTTVFQSAYAGMPPTHTCMTCHSQIWQNAPMLQLVRDSLARNEPLPWKRVYRLPRYVFFDHSIHVNKGIGCASCHGQVERMPLTWKVRSFYMRDCLSCHREPEKYIRPNEEVLNMDWEAPKDQLERGRKLVREYHVPKDRLTDCYTCHR